MSVYGQRVSQLPVFAEHRGLFLFQIFSSSFFGVVSALSLFEVHNSGNVLGEPRDLHSVLFGLYNFSYKKKLKGSKLV